MSRPAEILNAALLDEPVPSGPVSFSTDAPELADVGTVRALRAKYLADPEGTLALLQTAWQESLTHAALIDALDKAEAYLLEPEKAAAALRAESEVRVVAFGTGATDDQFFAQHAAEPYKETFQGKSIQLKANSHAFEDDGPIGILGWILNSGVQVVQSAFEKEFRSHAKYESRFIYPRAPAPASDPLKLAIFADFGTGLAMAKTIALQLQQDAFPLAFYLGDVYYTGTVAQFESYFHKPLAWMTKPDSKTELFMLPDNHEQLSGYAGYRWYQDTHLNPKKTADRQEGSYFCVELETHRLQIIGIDAMWGTGIVEPAKYHWKERVEWLDEILKRGRAKRWTNILLSGHEPYTHDSQKITELGKDIGVWAKQGLIDLWFWGNTHYAAMFEPGPAHTRTWYHGSCVAHAAFPYARVKKGKSIVTAEWVDESRRYPAQSGLRQSRGNNGFTWLEVDGDSIFINFRDWLGHEVHRVQLVRDANGSMLPGAF